MRVVACDRTSPFHVVTRWNGARGAEFSLGEGGEHRVEFPREQGRHGLSSIAVRIDHASLRRAAPPVDGAVVEAVSAPGSAPAPLCIAEVELISDGRPLPLRPPRTVRGRVRPSSSRDDGWSSAVALTDDRPDTAWHEGASGRGEGERILFVLDEAVELSAIEVWNGDQRSSAAWEGAARVTRLRVEPEGGEPFAIDVPAASGPANEGPHKVAFPQPIIASSLTLVIDGVSGSPEREGVAVSELRFWDRFGPIHVEATVERSPSSMPPEWLDGQWRSVCGYPRRTMKMRSNGSFVYTGRERDERSGAMAAYTMEGRWSAENSAVPWLPVGIRATRQRDEVSWKPRMEAPPRVEGELAVASVRDLGPQGVRAVLDEWGREGGGRGARRPGRADRVDCITEELGAWKDAWSALLANDALIVRTEDGDLGLTDLVWREQGK